jgi:hypothetical protein
LKKNQSDIIEVAIISDQKLILHLDVKCAAAIIAMNNDTIYTIDSPGKLRRLEDSEEKVKDRVLVSQFVVRSILSHKGWGHCGSRGLGVSVADPVSDSAVCGHRRLMGAELGWATLKQRLTQPVKGISTLCSLASSFR